MEKFESVYERTKDFLNFLKMQNYENVLIVTHNINASMIEDFFEGLKVEFNNDKHILRFQNSDVKIFNM